MAEKSGLRGPSDADYLCICNPAAGPRKDVRRILSFIERSLEERGRTVLVARTKYSGHAAQLARRLSPGRRAVIAVGGDGTLREIASGIDPSVPLGVIPLGTVNVLAKDLGIPEDTQRALETILENRVVSIDLARLRDEVFLLMASAGLDAVTVHNVNRISKRFLGQFAYALAGLRSSLTTRPRLYRVGIVDRGEKREIVERGYLVIVSNGRYYAGKFTINPSASLRSGKLHVMIYKRPGLIDNLVLVFKVLSGQMLKFKDVSFFTADEVTIEGKRRPPTMQFDGDRAPGGPVRITIQPGALKVLVPRGPGSQTGRGVRNGDS